MMRRKEYSFLLLPTILALLLFIVHLCRDIIAQESVLRPVVPSKSALPAAVPSPPPPQPPSQAPSTAQAPFVENVYKPIFYLKTHKTGSTSIAHALYAYTKRHGLSTLDAPGHVLVNKVNNGSKRWDAAVGHHFTFDRKVINSYLKAPPKLTLTSLRLPLQRQVSWFRQQNKQWEGMKCEGKNQSLLAYYDAWKGKIGAQWRILQERGSREELQDDAMKIIEQFDFVFLKERLRESYECLCKKMRIRLCDQERPMMRKNVKPRGSCVEEQLIKYRSAELVREAEKDMLLYEIVQAELSRCQRSVPSECRCPEMIDGSG